MKQPKYTLRDIAKTVAAAVGTIATAVVAAYADDVVNLPEWQNIAVVTVVAAATVYGVFKTRNYPLPVGEPADMAGPDELTGHL